MPWNQTTFWGYFAEIGVDCFFAMSYLIANGTILIFYLSICIHLKEFYEIFKSSIEKWNTLNRNYDDFKFMADLIRFHASIRE